MRLSYKFIVASSLLVASNAMAQGIPQPESTIRQLDMKVICDDAKKMFGAITEKYKELPAMMALDPENKVEYYLTFNPEKSSWTLIGVSTQGNMACLIASGQGAMFKLPPVKKDDSL